MNMSPRMWQTLKMKVCGQSLAHLEIIGFPAPPSFSGHGHGGRGIYHIVYPCTVTPMMMFFTGGGVRSKGRSWLQEAAPLGTGTRSVLCNRSGLRGIFKVLGAVLWVCIYLDHSTN